MPPSSPEEPGGGASLDADNPSMWQVVLGYMLPVSGTNLTWPDFPQDIAE